MRAVVGFLVRACASQPVQAIAGAVMTVFGVNYDSWLKRWAGDPPPFLANHFVQLGIIISGVFILAYIFYRQANEEKDEGAHIKRLRWQPYSTFSEIASGIAQSDPAFTKEEILERLNKAAFAKEFYSLLNHSRMKIKAHPKSTQMRPTSQFCIEDMDGISEADWGGTISTGKFIYEHNLFVGALNEANFESTGQIVIERKDFARWYRRFRSGRYEK
jgi:hypothetical protein